MTNFGRAMSPDEAFERAKKVTHFGPGGRDDAVEMPEILQRVAMANPFLRPHAELLKTHMGTQGDGNHFLTVGTLASTGDTCVVTHHGSRGPGAKVFKAGMKIAEEFRRRISPDTPKGAAWIPADTDEGRAYWDALQILRAWTKFSHRSIHAMISDDARDFVWNEHNFVFRRDDGLYYHAKGATPGWGDYDRTLVPMNMKRGVLVMRGLQNERALDFLPHGAGRNLSRTAYLNGIDRDEAFSSIDRLGVKVHFYLGEPDLSELPGAYKDPDIVINDMKELAEITDRVVPHGVIMAGDSPLSWRKRLR